MPAISAARVAERYAAQVAAHRALEALAELRGARERELAALRALVEDADELELEAGEEDGAARRARPPASPRPRCVAAAADAAERVNPEEGAGALSLAGDAAHELEGAAELDPGLAAPLADLQEAVARLREAGVELRRYLQELEAEPGRLDHVEARLGRLAEAARRHGAVDADAARRPGGRGARRTRVGRRGRRGGGEAAARVARSPMPSSRPPCRRSARSEPQRREPFARIGRGAPRRPRAWSTRGSRSASRTASRGRAARDDVELFLQANPGLAATPIARTASGGELSRIALAVRLAARDRSARPTLVFDEVDAGSRGPNGARPRREAPASSSEHTQLLCITHLPQIAALAERHFRVVKTAGEPSETRIDELSGDGVIEELVRMLGADVGDPDARALAVSLRSG